MRRSLIHVNEERWYWHWPFAVVFGVPAETAGVSCALAAGGVAAAGVARAGKELVVDVVAVVVGIAVVVEEEGYQQGSVGEGKPYWL